MHGLNNVSNTGVELGTKSDAITPRDTGTEFVIQDKGNTGIDTTTPHGSAILDVQATDKGFLPPRVILTKIQ